MSYYVIFSDPQSVFYISLRCAGQQHGGLIFAWGSHLTDSFPLPPHLSLPFSPLPPFPAAQKCLLILIDNSLSEWIVPQQLQNCFFYLVIFGLFQQLTHLNVQRCDKNMLICFFFVFVFFRKHLLPAFYVLGYFIWSLSFFLSPDSNNICRSSE